MKSCALLLNQWQRIQFFVMILFIVVLWPMFWRIVYAFIVTENKVKMLMRWFWRLIYRTSWWNGFFYFYLIHFYPNCRWGNLKHPLSIAGLGEGWSQLVIVYCQIPCFVWKISHLCEKTSVDIYKREIILEQHEKLMLLSYKFVLLLLIFSL